MYAWILLALLSVILFSRKAIRQGIKSGVLEGAGNVTVVQATGSAPGTGNGFGGKGTGPISPSLSENSRSKEILEEYNS